MDVFGLIITNAIVEEGQQYLWKIHLKILPRITENIIIE